MATLTQPQLSAVRRAVASKLGYDIDTTGWTPDQINGAIQFLEDWYESEKPIVNAGLNTATTPTVLTARVKEAMVIEFIRLKLEREESA